MAHTQMAPIVRVVRHHAPPAKDHRQTAQHVLLQPSFTTIAATRHVRLGHIRQPHSALLVIVHVVVARVLLNVMAAKQVSSY